MIRRHVVKSCCGNKSFIFESDKPIKKNHLAAFQQAGYLVPTQYVNIGLFYVQMEGLVVTASLGTTKFQVRCSSKNADQLLNSFEALLDQVLHS